MDSLRMNDTLLHGNGLQPVLDAGAVTGLQQFVGAGLECGQVAVADRLAYFKQGGRVQAEFGQSEGEQQGRQLGIAGSEFLPS